MKVMIGMSRRRQISNSLRVRASIPLAASITITAESTAVSVRYVSSEKSSWPGVSSRLNTQPACWNVITEVTTEMPRRRSPLARTEPASWIAPPARSRCSVSVVLPASGWEMIAKVRRRTISAAGLGKGSAIVPQKAMRRGPARAARGAALHGRREPAQADHDKVGGQRAVRRLGDPRKNLGALAQAGSLAGRDPDDRGAGRHEDGRLAALIGDGERVRVLAGDHCADGAVGHRALLAEIPGKVTLAGTPHGGREDRHFAGDQMVGGAVRGDADELPLPDRAQRRALHRNDLTGLGHQQGRLAAAGLAHREVPAAEAGDRAPDGALRGCRRLREGAVKAAKADTKPNSGQQKRASRDHSATP